ncbi:MAG: ferrochelatase [Pseudomonadota bacterium]
MSADASDSGPDDGSFAPPDHPAIPPRRVGVLLVNLGTPDAAEPKAVRRYLKEFLSDRRVIDYPKALWAPILHGIILNTRPAKTAKAYASIWMEDENASPLAYYTQRHSDLLAERLGGAAVVDYAMRYGNPSIKSRLRALQEKGCDRILIVPLYPQYSATTTATVCDAAFDALKELRWTPAVRIAPPFHDEMRYIKALGESVRRAFAKAGSLPERVVISFHGLPERYFLEGDPYHCHCQKTARLLREEMGWTKDYAPITFQSKFGPETWLGPATDATLHRFADEGVKDVAVITPGFVADCIETLEEIGIAAKEDFVEAGGRSLLQIPCLNDAPEAIDLYETIVRRELSGWATPVTTPAE